MTTWGIVGLAVVLAYIAVCFGRIAGKHGRNPILYGILSIISPVNLVLLGIWAFSRVESTEREIEMARSAPVEGAPSCLIPHLAFSD